MPFPWRAIHLDNNKPENAEIQKIKKAIDNANKNAKMPLWPQHIKEMGERIKGLEKFIEDKGKLIAEMNKHMNALDENIKNKDTLEDTRAKSQETKQKLSNVLMDANNDIRKAIEILGDEKAKWEFEKEQSKAAAEKLEEEIADMKKKIKKMKESEEKTNLERQLQKAMIKSFAQLKKEYQDEKSILELKNKLFKMLLLVPERETKEQKKTRKRREKRRRKREMKRKEKEEAASTSSTKEEISTSSMKEEISTSSKRKKATCATKEEAEKKAERLKKARKTTMKTKRSSLVLDVCASCCIS